MKDANSILLVDDDKIDAMTVKRAFKELRVSNELIHLTDGEKALTYLLDPDLELPNVILLDINMPRMNGIELLEAIKNNEALNHIPVVMLTTSNKDFDILESFRLSAAGYLVKPVNYMSFLDAIHTFDLYWTLSELPDSGEEAEHVESEIISTGSR